MQLFDLTSFNGDSYRQQVHFVHAWNIQKGECYTSIYLRNKWKNNLQFSCLNRCLELKSIYLSVSDNQYRIFIFRYTSSNLTSLDVIVVWSSKIFAFKNKFQKYWLFGWWNFMTQHKTFWLHRFTLVILVKLWGNQRTQFYQMLYSSVNDNTQSRA